MPAIWPVACAAPGRGPGAAEVRAADHPHERACWFLGGEADGVDVIEIMATGGLMTPGFGVHESQYGPIELRAECEAAHDCALAVTVHAHGPRGIAESVAAGVDGVEHATSLTADGVELDVDTVDQLAAAGVFVGATEAWLPGGPSLPAADALRLEQCRANVRGCSGPVSGWCAARTPGSGRASRATCCRTESSCSPVSGSARWRRWAPRPAWRRGRAGSAVGRAGWSPASTPTSATALNQHHHPPTRHRHPHQKLCKAGVQLLWECPHADVGLGDGQARRTRRPPGGPL